MSKARCKAPDCEADATRKGYCEKHRRRVRKYGDPLVNAPRGGTLSAGPNHFAVRQGVSYRAVHMRLTKWIGPASSFICPCGEPAQQWAYDHLDPQARDSGQGPYSEDISHYIAMCISCHKTFDLARLRETA